ncbi:MAG: hypothetical protein C0507_05930 [Cyanobacteria bacterium PR.3.49]|nr:hypothetical protein [Cyanobacteria bacterium PR.3.49]
MKKRKKSGSINLRSVSGLHLIELLSAIFISGLLAVVLSSSLSEVIRLTTKTDRAVLAATAAQEIIDRIRSTPFHELPSSGTYDIQVNLGDSDSVQVSPSGGFIAQRPAMLDGTKLTWQASPSSGTLPSNRFRGTITVSISDLAVANAKRVVVDVRWTESTSIKERLYETSTVVAANGIMRHEID